ncbi:MAG: nucleotidyltransferase domain-containing protein [Roseburia sp.]|nr:nucleotidyltransferase domain-containing protein [Roseburia sp.]
MKEMINTGVDIVVWKEIEQFAEKYKIQKVILFGSRARGDYRRTSDIDLAVYGGDVAAFMLDVDEETSTLLKFDIVNMDKPVQEELKQSIGKEGRVIYEVLSDVL